MCTTAVPASGRLLHLGVLRFSGPDALSFLQGQVSNDTRRLAEHRSVFAAYSSPQGRVLALLHLLPHSSGVLAILPRDLLLPTLQSLRKYVMRAKVNIEDASELLAVSGVHGSEQIEAAGVTLPMEANAYLESDGVALAAVNHDPSRCWMIAAPQTLAARGMAGEAERIEHDWRLSDIRRGLPQIYLATREAFVAQMLNLDLLDGISFSKGCYTGQEIVARTQHRGRIKRRMYRLQLPQGAWQVGQALRLTDGRAGRVTELAQVNGHCEALAVLHEAAEMSDADPQTSTSVAAVPLALPYELATGQ
jgi:folate-binding protein YgfZ